MRPADLPAAKRGPRGVLGRMMEKAERFRPGAGARHKEEAGIAYLDAKRAGNSERDAIGSITPATEIVAVPVDGGDA